MLTTVTKLDNALYDSIENLQDSLSIFLYECRLRLSFWYLQYNSIFTILYYKITVQLNNSSIKLTYNLTTLSRLY